MGSTGFWPRRAKNNTSQMKVFGKSAFGLIMALAALVFLASSCASEGHGNVTGNSSGKPSVSNAKNRSSSSRTTGAARSGEKIEVSDLHDISFLSPSSGWALGEVAGKEVIARSNDGGILFRQWGSPLPGDHSAFSSSLVVVDSSHSVGSSGQLYGVISFRGSKEVYVSNNGLRNWKAVLFPAPVLAIAADPLPNPPAHPEGSAAGAAIQPLWVLFGPVPATETAIQEENFGVPGTLVIGLLYPGNSGWKPYGALAGPAWLGYSKVTYARFARTGAENGYVALGGVLYGGSKAAGPVTLSFLEHTSNYGFTWQTLPDPCRQADSYSAYLSAVSSRVLWMGCAGQPSAGMEGKVVYESSDGASSWSRVWGGPWTKGHSLSMTAGYLQDVVGLSNYEAYVALGRGPLLRTTNGGKKWLVAIPHIGGSGGIIQLDVFNSSHAWALVGGGRLWATSNGRVWHQLAGPKP